MASSPDLPSHPAVLTGYVALLVLLIAASCLLSGVHELAVGVMCSLGAGGFPFIAGWALPEKRRQSPRTFAALSYFFVFCAGVGVASAGFKWWFDVLKSRIQP
jgi:hypothetical protein